MMQLPIVLFISLLSFSLTLHTSKLNHLLFSLKTTHLQSINHQPPIDQITSIKTLCEQVNKNMTENNAQKYKFLINQSSQIENSLNNLHSTLSKYHLVINHSSKLCPGVTTFNRTEIREVIVSIELRQKESVQYLATCIDCSFVTDSFLKIQSLTKQYIRKVNKTLDGVYCDSMKVSSQQATGVVNLNSSYFKNNLNAKNWIYGSTTASDYKLYIFQRSAMYNLTSCPLNKPFVKDQQQVCFDCPEDAFYNIGKKACDQCHSNQILNRQSGSCDSCLGEKKLVDGIQVCRLCMLSNGELFNSTTGHCYTCSKNTYLDADKLACITINCPGNTPRFNRTTKQCSACPQSYIIDPKDAANCIKTNYIAFCNPTTPRYDIDTKTCSACQQGTVYNKDTNQCIQQTSHQTYVNKLSHETQVAPCPADKPSYNPNTNQCESCKEGQSYSPTQKSCIAEIICAPTETLNTISQKCVDTASTCPDNQVYVSKVNRCLPKSVTCDENQYYNPLTKLCTQKSLNCNIDQYYDIKTKQCAPKNSNCKANEEYNRQLHICQKLVECQQNQQYVPEKKMCQSIFQVCYSKNQLINMENESCLRLQLASPYSKYLVFQTSGDYDRYLAKYNQIKQKYPLLKDCPTQNQKGFWCPVCPKQQPYFNQQMKCVKCQDVKNYYKGCQNQSATLDNISPTIKRINI